MATTHRFLGIDNDIDLLLRWFEDSGEPFQRSDRSDAVVLHFFKIGRLVEAANGELLQDQSPLVWIVKPKLSCRSLWTGGEVTFTPTPLRRQFPGMSLINRRFAAWLRGFPLVYSHEGKSEFEYGYFLEGSLKNWDGPLFALPAAHEGLRQGQYFVHHTDSDDCLDRVCRKLRLRGVDADVPV